MRWDETAYCSSHARGGKTKLERPDDAYGDISCTDHFDFTFDSLRVGWDAVKGYSKGISSTVTGFAGKIFIIILYGICLYEETRSYCACCSQGSKS